jgi:hypothetical protein
MITLKAGTRTPPGGLKVISSVGHPVGLRPVLRGVQGSAGGRAKRALALSGGSGVGLCLAGRGDDLVDHIPSLREGRGPGQRPGGLLRRSRRLFVNPRLFAKCWPAMCPLRCGELPRAGRRGDEHARRASPRRAPSKRRGAGTARRPRGSGIPVALSPNLQAGTCRLRPPRIDDRPSALSEHEPECWRAARRALDECE